MNKVGNLPLLWSSSVAGTCQFHGRYNCAAPLPSTALPHLYAERMINMSAGACLTPHDAQVLAVTAVHVARHSRWCERKIAQYTAVCVLQGHRQNRAAEQHSQPDSTLPQHWPVPKCVSHRSMHGSCECPGPDKHTPPDTTCHTNTQPVNQQCQQPGSTLSPTT
jgi:hypothetical protein